MNDQDQYGRYMAQQPQHINSNDNNNYNGFDNTRPYSNPDYAQSSTGFARQQQMMYGEDGAYAEQRGEGRYPQNEGYGVQEYYAGSGEKLRPMPPRRRHRSWLWYIVIPVMLFFLAGGLFGMHKFSEGIAVHSWPIVEKGEHQGFKGFGQPGLDTFSQTYTYNGSTLHINVADTNGSVHIDSNSDARQVIVNVQSLDGQNAQNVPLKFDSGAGQLSFDASQFGPGYNVTIDVPSSVTTVDMQVQDGSGGDVNVEGISGQLNLSSQDGSITLSQDNLSGQSSIKTQNGSIDFNGSLSQQGSYDFESNNGSINLQLPSNASFQLVNSIGNLNNDFNRTSVGSSPRPSLTVNSQSGDIFISPGQ